MAFVGIEVVNSSPGCASVNLQQASSPVLIKLCSCCSCTVKCELFALILIFPTLFSLPFSPELSRTRCYYLLKVILLSWGARGVKISDFHSQSSGRHWIRIL